MAILYSIFGSLFASDLLIWWWSVRMLSPTVQLWLRFVLHGFFVFQIVSLLVLLWGAATRHWELPLPVLILVFLWHLLVVPLTLMGILTGCVAEFFSAVIRFFGNTPGVTLSESGNGVSRREFLGTIAAFAPPVLTLSLGAYAAARLNDFRVRRLTITIPSLPSVLEGMTIVHLSDLHVGQFTNGPVLKKIVKTVNAMQPDLMLFTGDLINNALSWLPEGIEWLRELYPQPVLCEGNHDLIENGAEFETQVKQAGFPLLLNEALTVSVRGVPVQLLGLRWEAPSGERSIHGEGSIAASMQELLKHRDMNAFPIVLAHHSHAWDHCDELPLMLSGHTHGGQLMVNERMGMGPVLFRYWSGVYTRPTRSGTDRQTLVVNNGIGNWFPLRTEAPAEIIHLTLVRGE